MLFIATLAACATHGRPAGVQAGYRLFQTAFDPDRIFEGDLRPSSDDQLVLTVAASNRDDYAPAYSLAIAFRCLPTGEADSWECRYVARTLRVGPPGEEQTGRSFALLSRVQNARNSDEMTSLLDNAGLEWLEADVNGCANGILAMDSIRVADWRPDIHYALQPVEDRTVILHPAMISVRMSGNYTTSRYRGWVLADGVPAAVRRLLETLEPCWRPLPSPPPWKRRVNGERR